uniref:Uncharacterized protein n=1 Tax=Periophthalmus magnuspinnatus TaxID=409849 RepID=A0A3B4B6D4_9GOBI
MPFLHLPLPPLKLLHLEVNTLFNPHFQTSTQLLIVHYSYSSVSHPKPLALIHQTEALHGSPQLSISSRPIIRQTAPETRPLRSPSLAHTNLANHPASELPRFLPPLRHAALCRQ